MVARTDIACGASGIDFAGGTLLQLVHNIDTSATCRKLCQESPDCTHFFFFRSILFAETLGGSCQLRRYPILSSEDLEEQLKQRQSILSLKEEERRNRLELLEIDRNKRKEERRAKRLNERRQLSLLKEKESNIKNNKKESIINRDSQIIDIDTDDKDVAGKSEEDDTTHESVLLQIDEGQKFETKPTSKRRLESLSRIIEGSESVKDKLEGFASSEGQDSDKDDADEESSDLTEDDGLRELDEIAEIDKELAREFAEDDNAFFEAKHELENDETIAILSIPLFSGVPHATPHFVKTLPGSETHFGSAFCPLPELPTTTTTTTAPFVAPPNYCEKVEEDFYGHDLQRRASLSSAECQHQCKRTEACVGYTFMPRQRICLLKWYLLPRPVPAFISGLRCCSDSQSYEESLFQYNNPDEFRQGNAAGEDCVAPRQPLCLWPGKAIVGWDMEEEWSETNSAAACQRNCDRDLKCDAWTYRGEPHNQCQLKRAPFDSPADVVRPLRMAATVILEASEKLNSVSFSKSIKLADIVADARRTVDALLPQDPVGERMQRRAAVERLSLLIPYSESISGLPECPMFGDVASPGRRYKQIRKLLAGLELQQQQEYEQQQAALKKQRSDKTKRRRKSSTEKRSFHLLSSDLLNRLQKRRHEGSRKTPTNTQKEQALKADDGVEGNEILHSISVNETKHSKTDGNPES